MPTCFEKRRMFRRSGAAVAGILAAVALLGAGAAQAYETDVHFGLTRWLARQAGFNPGQATAIALGDVRVDSGLIDTMELNLEHVCVGLFPEAAADVQRRHYPSAVPVPARPEARAVVAGSAAARQPLAELWPLLPGKEALMLSKLGEAMHTLQDSWSYAGTPGVPEPGAGIACDAAYASGHPAARDGAHPHGAALTHLHPADALAMAAATYETLRAYPPVSGAARQAKPWAALAPLVERFAQARSKTEKRDWFVGQGDDDTGFLRDISLPDGPRPGPSEFHGRLLPPLPDAASKQYDTSAELKRFFDPLFARWLSAEPVEAVVAALGDAPGAAARRELTARLKLWKLRDHGAAAGLAHARGPLNAAQLKALDRLVRAPSAFVQPGELRQAFFPLLAKSKYPPPLLPYIVRELPPSPAGRARSIAITRLQHTPYDTLGLIAERGAKGWALVELVSAVDQ